MRDYIIMTDSGGSLNQAEVSELELRFFRSATIEARPIGHSDHAGMHPKHF